MVLSIENKGLRMENIVVPEPNTVDSIYELLASIEEYMGIEIRVWLESYIKNIEATMDKDSYEDGYSDAISAAIDALNML